MRKINPEEIPPICSDCQTPMVIDLRGMIKFWRCRNKCGGKPIVYYESKKKIEQRRLIK